MTDLSPAAQQILAAYENSPFEYDTGHLTACAAVLRAAADQVIPIKKEPVEPPGYGIGYEPAEYLQDWTRWHVRSQFLAIAAELEAKS
jgi:hypothetical protein